MQVAAASSFFGISLEKKGYENANKYLKEVTALLHVPTRFHYYFYGNVHYCTK